MELKRNVENTNYKNYKPRPREANSSRYKYNIYHLENLVKGIIWKRNQNQTKSEPESKEDDLEGEGLKTIIPSNIIDIYTQDLESS